MVGMDRSFHGQMAVVTGGARGLGLAISTLLTERGARVHILDKDQKALELAISSLQAKDAAVSGDVVDVSDEVAVIAAAKCLGLAHGDPQILINNAGYFPFDNVMTLTEADWDRVFAVNTKSALFCTRTFGKQMMGAGYGRIVNIVSAGAYGANPTLPHYAAAKAALLSITRTFALEFAPYEVLVNGVSPGNVATENSVNAEWLVERIPSIPVRRAAEPREIAQIVSFLASRQNRYIVGETIIASGGYVMA